MKRARVAGIAFIAIGVGLIGLLLAPGEPESRFSLVLWTLFAVCGTAMVWKPEWADGKHSSGYLQREAGGSWLLLGGSGVVVGLAALAVALGSTVAG